MANKKGKKIELANCNSIRFPVVDKVEHDMFIIGNFDGIFGTFVQAPTGKLDFNLGAGDALKINGGAVIKTIQSKKHVYLLSTEETAKYFMNFLTICRDKGFFDSVGRSAAINKYFHYSIIDLNKDDKEIIDCVNNRIFKNLNRMKFDNVIQNPPYGGTLHLDFEELGVNMMSDNGHMVIVQPAVLYTDVFNPSSTYVTGKKENKGPKLKSENSKYAKRVSIDNLNKDFGTSIDTPFAITTFDFDDSKSGEQIEFICFGAKRIVNTLNDCNLIGNSELANSIIKKGLSYGDKMEAHIFKKSKFKERDGLYFLRFWDDRLYALGSNYGKVTNQYRNKTIAVFRELPYGNYFSSYVDSLFYKDVCETIPVGRKNECDCLCGTKEELENWKYNASHLKILMFLSQCVTSDRHNNAKKIVPFLCKKKYTNEEANELLGITEREAKFIDYTLEKFEYDSPWFRRYICGPEAATDDEVQDFIDKLDMKYA